MSEFLAEASVLIKPDTTKFRALLQAELNAATKAIPLTVPVTPVASGATGAAFKQSLQGSKDLAVANSNVAFTARQAAVAETKKASASQVAGAADKAAAKAATQHAAAMEQLRRGAGATGLSLLGARGATLAAGSEFLIGAAAVTLFAKTLKGAAEDEEALAATTTFLGESLSTKLAAQADDLVGTFGLVDDEVLRFESSLAQIFNAVDVSDAKVAQFSETLVKLAADVGAVKDIPVADVFKALQSALLGNLRGLRQLSIGLSAVEINQRALADSGKEQVSSLTDQEKIMARYALILEKTAGFQGAFAAESDRVTGRGKILRAQIDDISDSIGTSLLPFITKTVTALSDLAGAFIVAKNKMDDFTGSIPGAEGATKDFVDTLLTSGPEMLKQFGGSVKDVAELLGAEFPQAFDVSQHKINDFFDSLRLAGGFFPLFLQNMSDAEIRANALAGALERSGNAARLFAANIAGLSGKLLDLQFAGASPAAQIANLQKQLEAVNAAIADPRQRGTILQNKQQRNQIQAQIQGIIDQQAADAKAAADAAQRAADEAARAAEEQRRLNDQRIQDLIAQQQGQAEINLVTAGTTAGLQDDINAQKKINALIKQQIRVLVPQIQDARLRAQVLLQLKAAEAEGRAALLSLIEERKKARQEAKQAAAEALAEAKANALESLRLKVQIAEAEDNTNKQIAALKRLIRAEEKQLAQMKKDTNEKKRLKLQIEQDKAALNDLQNAAKDQGNAARDFFEFLQRQQGFAANLLGNLFPGGTASAAVGGTTPGPGGALLPPGGPVGGPGFAGDVNRGLSAAAQTSQGGTTAGQTNTVIALLRQIAHLLALQQRGTQHPEAQFNRQVGSAVADIM